MVDAVIRGQAENDVKEVSPDDPMSVSKYGDDFYDQRDRSAIPCPPGWWKNGTGAMN